MKTIKILYHTDFDEPIKAIDKGDWIDLKSARDYTYKKGDFFITNSSKTPSFSYGDIRE